MQADGHSLDAQLAACRRLATERGWQITHEYSDVESARTTDRPQFTAMLAAAEQRAFDVIVVHKLDRFSRSVTDTLFTLRRLSQAGIGFVSISEQFDYSTPIGKVMLTMLAAFAEWYLDNLAQETSKGKRERATKGRWNGMLPFGYTAQYRKDGGDGLPRIDDKSAAGVRLAFEQYAAGTRSDYDIAQLLNEAGYRPQGRGARALPLWSADSVRVLLQNRFYLGEAQYKGEWRKGEHPPIIDANLFARCQQVRARRRPRYGTTQQHGTRVYPLSGLALCSHCHGHMRGTPDSYRHQRRYYICPAWKRGTPCTHRAIDAVNAEGQIAELLATIQIPDDWQTAVLQMLQDGPHDLEAERRKIETRLERLRRLFIMQDIDEAEYTRERDSLSAQLGTLTPPQEVDVQKAAELLSDFGAVWQAANDGERRDLLRVMLDAVYLDAEAGQVTAIQPKPELAPLLSLAHTGTTGIASAGASKIRIILPWAPLESPTSPPPTSQ